MASGPLVTIALVTYNGAHWLPGCLASVAAQDHENIELLVLDNASSDASAQVVQDFPLPHRHVTITESATNLGYAGGHNRLIFQARGEFVLLLNQDVELDAGFVGAAVERFVEMPSVASVQARVRRLTSEGVRTDELDTTGLEMHRDRRVIARGQHEPDGPRFAVAGLVWGADGPCPVYRRAALHDARVRRRGGRWEILDEDFFMYKEDIDLAWRLRLLGWSAWYEPSALAWHARGAGGSTRDTIGDLIAWERRTPRWIKSTSWRNHRLMLLKNETVRDYVRDLPWIATRDLASVALAAIVDPRRLGMLGDFVRLAPAAMRKRRQISRRRRPHTH